jgi:hypothetical protein
MVPAGSTIVGTIRLLNGSGKVPYGVVPTCYKCVTSDSPGQFISALWRQHALH